MGRQRSKLHECAAEYIPEAGEADVSSGSNISIAHPS